MSTSEGRRLQELRRSNASGRHKDRRVRGGRRDQKRAAIEKEARDNE